MLSQVIHIGYLLRDSVVERRAVWIGVHNILGSELLAHKLPEFLELMQFHGPIFGKLDATASMLVALRKQLSRHCLCLVQLVADLPRVPGSYYLAKLWNLQ